MENTPKLSPTEDKRISNPKNAIQIAPIIDVLVVDEEKKANFKQNSTDDERKESVFSDFGSGFQFVKNEVQEQTMGQILTY